MLSVGPGPWTEQGRTDIIDIDRFENHIDSQLNKLEPDWRNMNDFSIPTITLTGDPVSILKDRMKRAQLGSLIEAKKELESQRGILPFDETDGLKEFDSRLVCFLLNISTLFSS